MKENRLDALKETKFLSTRIFRRLSENIHYEMFKYLDYRDLLEVRRTKLGGFQLTTNKILRARIKNYLPELKFKFIQTEKRNLIEEDFRIKIIFEQTGTQILNLEKTKMDEMEFECLIQIIKINPQINGMKLGN